MTTYFVMTIFLLSGSVNGGAAIEKLGVFESRADCMVAGTDAGLTHISSINTVHNNFYFTCVSAGDPYGVEE
jgi:hypothetical protein